MNFSSVEGTIDSINVGFDRYLGSGSEPDRRFIVQLTKTGGGDNTGVGDPDTVSGPQIATCAASADTVLGGNVKWNTTWTPSDFTGGTFAVMVWDYNALAAFFGFDAIWAIVYYTPPAAKTHWMIYE
jgi:hypothetical protein